ncbi:MAG: 2-oxo acid dehydrogenase subunit E2 [Pseudomonadota bacterium]|nr:2-oxo acid dehydrogenase subunit E2 [Pseudomonadota bacterium]
MKVIKIPGLGGIDEVQVAEILVSPGDQVVVDAPILTLESEKASMDVPAPESGIIVSIQVKVGDTLTEGAEVAMFEPLVKQDDGQDGDVLISAKNEDILGGNDQVQEDIIRKISSEDTPVSVKDDLDHHVLADGEGVSSKARCYASPSVRRLAGLLGINLSQVIATGPKNRVTRDDLLKVIKSSMSNAPNPKITSLDKYDDPGRYGEIEKLPLSRLKQITAKRMTESWQSVPHVTQFELIDVTDVEASRQLCKQQVKDRGVRLTLLAFVIKAMADALVKHPHMNAVFDQNASSLLLRRYIHIGVAVDTPEGLVVPVLKHVDQDSILVISEKLADLSEKSRAQALLPADMMGGGFTISSLGGIGGTYFTPIINPPQVAILGVSKATYQSVWKVSQFERRLMMPVSLSYDHRVIDGAEAMRFLKDFAEILSCKASSVFVKGLDQN